MAMVLEAGAVMERTPSPLEHEQGMVCDRPTTPMEFVWQEWQLSYTTLPYYGDEVETIGAPPPPPAALLDIGAAERDLQKRILILMLIGCCLWLLIELLQMVS